MGQSNNERLTKTLSQSGMGQTSRHYVITEWRRPECTRRVELETSLTLMYVHVRKKGIEVEKNL